MLNSHPKGGSGRMCASRCLASVEHLAIRHPHRMRIEHWELSIGQIPGRIQGSGFCQVIFVRALKEEIRMSRNWFVVLFTVAFVTMALAATPAAADTCADLMSNAALKALPETTITSAA